MLKTLFITACLASTLIACSTTTPSVQTAENIAALQQKNWVLTHIGEMGFKIDPSAHNTPSLNFNNHDLTGTDGCNRIKGSYNVQANKLNFSQMISTQKACLDSTDITDRFKSAINNVTFFNVSDSTLKLLDKDKKLILQFQSN